MLAPSLGLRHGMRMARRRGIFGTAWRAVVYGVFSLVIVFFGLLALWTVAPPISTLMMGRAISGQGYVRDYVRLPAIAPILVASVVTSEDGQFCRNHGVDWGELRDVMSDPDGPSRGASTITMQTAKNLFLWPGRSAIRKGIEIPIALVLGKVWSKAHTIEVYLNIAEWGDGIFGIEAASRRYFHKSARQLDAREAALLATALPNPRERDPSDPSLIQRRLAARLASRTRDGGASLACLSR
jgi:monofunctional biosynthetic peptidoglycan transglycosylase